MLSAKNFFANLTGSTAGLPSLLSYDVATKQVYSSTNPQISTIGVTGTIQTRADYTIGSIGATSFSGASTLQMGSTGNFWTIRTSAADNNWRSVTWGNNLFVAVAFTGTNNRVMTSPDGITWTSRTSAADNEWFSVTWGNNLFVAVSQTGTNNRVMTSPDGITWTSRTSAANNQWTSVTWGNNLFVAVSNSGTGNRVMTSPDGITWTIRTSASDNQWRSVTWGNNLFVAVAETGTGNRVMTSPDGITWTSRTSAADNAWFSVTWGNNLFVAVAGSGTGNRVMTSPDGITWTIRTSAADNFWFSVTWGNNLFVAVSNTGTGNRVMTSPDGITWTIRTSANDNDYRAVTFGNNLFVAVSFSGTGNRVMTSTSPIGLISVDEVDTDVVSTLVNTNNLYLEGGSTGFSLFSNSIYNSTTASSANVVVQSSGLLQRSTSSIKYKTQVEDILQPYADNVWQRSRPVWYRSTCMHEIREWSYYGFIAEEVADVEPRLCFWDAQNRPDGVMYERFLPLILKTLKKENDELEAEIQELEGVIERLELERLN